MAVPPEGLRSRRPCSTVLRRPTGVFILCVLLQPRHDGPGVPGAFEVMPSALHCLRDTHRHQGYGGLGLPVRTKAGVHGAAELKKIQIIKDNWRVRVSAGTHRHHSRAISSSQCLVQPKCEEQSGLGSRSRTEVRTLALSSAVRDRHDACVVDERMCNGPCHASANAL